MTHKTYIDLQPLKNIRGRAAQVLGTVVHFSRTWTKDFVQEDHILEDFFCSVLKKISKVTLFKHTQTIHRDFSFTTGSGWRLEGHVFKPWQPLTQGCHKKINVS